jgi:hypothetical protein
MTAEEKRQILERIDSDIRTLVMHAIDHGVHKQRLLEEKDEIDRCEGKLLDSIGDLLKVTL